MVIYQKLAVFPETYDLVINECKTEFLRNNPQFEGINITQEFIVRRIAKYYLDKTEKVPIIFH